MALGDIQYPHSWNNVDSNHFWFIVYVEGLDSETFRLPDGHYGSGKELVQRMRGLIKSTGSRQLNRNLADLETTAQDEGVLKKLFVFDGGTRLTTMNIPTGSSIFLSVPLYTLLGYRGTSRPLFPPGNFISQEKCGIENEFSSIFVYSDIVEPRIVGDAISLSWTLFLFRGNPAKLYLKGLIVSHLTQFE